MKFKDFKFDLKAEDEGIFTGLAAVYGNTDLGGDIIEPGAFTRTIKNSGGQVPILWQHNIHQPIGLGTLEDTKKGLKVEGRLVMESSQARETYALMKADVVKGLSFGYDVVVAERDHENETRRLKELKLWEVSPVTFPMNPKAQISSVKGWAMRVEELMDELTEEKGKLSPVTRENLLRLEQKIQALLAASDSAEGDSGKGTAPAAKDTTDPGSAHSLVQLTKETSEQWQRILSTSKN
jgi:HK97 family phage prohead protease